MDEPTGKKPQATVFYSWQSDLPNAGNRGLIQEALERAVKSVRNDDSLAVDPVIDRDTQNVPGAPDIARTIFEKIDKAEAFVADVSIINEGAGRPTPNPNVLIELGYVFKTLGASRTVLVANAATGPVELLPFDLRTKRVLTYHLPPGATDKPEQRKRLQEGLQLALRAILADTTPPQLPAAPSAADKAIASIQEGAASQGPLCAKVIPVLAERVAELTPILRRENEDQWDDDLVSAIDKTLPLATDFARVASEAAIHDAREAVLGLFRGFASLFSQYRFPPGVGGSYSEVQFDLPKFVGHEFVVILVSALIEEHRWGAVADLCRETVMIPSAGRRSPATAVTYLYASEFVHLLAHRVQRLKLHRLSLHADILKERHEAGDLGKLSPWLRFQDADVFLYLRSVLEQDEFRLSDAWRPWSAFLLDGCPDFLLEAVQHEKTERLREALGVKTITELRSRLQERAKGLAQMFGSHNPFFEPFHGLNPDLIGTK